METIKKIKQNAEKLTTEFFKRRFPYKNIEFEKKCGCFWEWMDRIKTGHPEKYMDNESLKVWNDILLDMVESEMTY